MTLLKKVGLFNKVGLFDKVGLFKGRGLLVRKLGPELITNGGFDNSDNWSLQTGWDISGGKANCDGSQVINSRVFQVDVVEILTKYLVTYDLIVTANTFFMNLADTAGVNRTVSDHYEEVITSGANVGGNCLAVATPGFVGSIDNVSVKEIL